MGEYEISITFNMPDKKLAMKYHKGIHIERMLKKFKKELEEKFGAEDIFSLYGFYDRYDR